MLGADKEHVATIGYHFDNRLVSGPIELDGFLQVDDVDSVTGPENVLFHLGVPALGLVAEMDPGLQQLPHCYHGHTVFSFVYKMLVEPPFFVKKPPDHPAPRLFFAPGLNSGALTMLPFELPDYNRKTCEFERGLVTTRKPLLQGEKHTKARVGFF